MAVGVDGRWHPGIGDPTLGGWLTVAAYLVTAALAARVALVQKERDKGLDVTFERGKLIGFWGITAAAMLLLGINKQLDLQSWLTEVLRDLSKQQGWHEVRRQYQIAFIVFLGCAGLLTTLVVAAVLRRVLRRIVGALVGLGVLGTFVVVRAASFHHVDALLLSGPLPLNWVLELGGLFLIALSAWLAGGSRA